MGSMQSLETSACESVLRSIRQYNDSHNIWPSENAVIDRFLRRSVELRRVYRELHSKLEGKPESVRTFFDAILGAAALWNPRKITEARDARSALVQVNEQIARLSIQLASLLDERRDLANSSAFRTQTHYHVCDVLVAAGQSNHGFTSYVQERLNTVRMQFDLKYWPSLGDTLRVLAADAAEAKPLPSDPLTAAATEGRRPSQADFIKAMLVAIDEVKGHSHHLVPVDFRLTDGSMATLVNCSLDLAEDECVGSEHMKRLRQRKREKSSQNQEGKTHDLD